MATETGLTLSDLSDMDPRELTFYVAALSEKNRRHNAEGERSKAQSRHAKAKRNAGVR